jgi:hypothetical protein
MRCGRIHKSYQLKKEAFGNARVGFNRNEVRKVDAIERVENGKHGLTRWRFVCDCGQETIAYSGNVKKGSTQSCGCQRRLFSKNNEHNLKHGMAGGRGKRAAPEYAAWHSMINRCENPNSQQWDNYGGRGIKVCDRWRNSFEAFFADMGPRPSPKHSIDRVVVNGDYEPKNVRWALPRVQAANRRNNLAMIGAQRRGDKFRSQIRIDGKTINLGTFDTPEAANSAYRAAVAEVERQAA